MAEKRMISKVISISEKVNSLPDLFDMLLFTWIIPHSDDFGRLVGSPAKVKALVVPMLDKSIKEVEQSLQRLHDANLIIWYEVNRDKYIQITNFEEHQSGLHKRTKSKFPEYIPGTSGNFSGIPLEGKGREQKGREEEGKGREQKGREIISPDSNPHKDRIHKLINAANIANYTLFDLDVIFSYIGVVDIEVIEAAIKKGSGKQSINYAINTLKGMIKDGITKSNQLPKGGQAHGEYEGESKGVRSGSDQETSGCESITGGQTGWLNSKYNQGNIIRMPNVSG